MSNLPPPPTPPRHAGRRNDTKSTSVYTEPSVPATGDKPTWKDGLKSKGKVWGKVAYEKSWKWSDQIGGKINNYAEKTGNERFWPTTGDFPQELEKCARIIRHFTVEGIATEVEAEVVQEGDSDSKPKAKKKVKLLRKIPPKVIQEALGLAIYTNFRTGIAPFGGSGGSGMVIARLPDGSWSPPSSISPNNYAAGLVYGVDIFDAVLIIRTQKALDSFYTHKATLGADIGVVAGPFGAGAVMEAGREAAPVFSYVKSRGLYAGVSILGQVFIERFEENGAMYHWPGVKASDILTGKVRMPMEAASLIQALKDAETGAAQAEDGNGLEHSVEQVELAEGEVLKLPPLPDMVDPEYGNDDPEATKIRRQSGSSTPTHSVPASSTAPRLVPPPLPPRFQSNASSASAYSDAVNEEQPVILSEKGHQAFHATGMDEGERREYEQYLEMLKQEEEHNRQIQQGTPGPIAATLDQPPVYVDSATPRQSQSAAFESDVHQQMEKMALNVNPADGRILEGTDEQPNASPFQDAHAQRNDSDLR